MTRDVVAMLRAELTKLHTLPAVRWLLVWTVVSLVVVSSLMVPSSRGSITAVIRPGS